MIEKRSSGVALSAITAVLLGVTGWYGGELAYRYKVGVINSERSLREDDELVGSM